MLSNSCSTYILKYMFNMCGTILVFKICFSDHHMLEFVLCIYREVQGSTPGFDVVHLVPAGFTF